VAPVASRNDAANWFINTEKDRQTETTTEQVRSRTPLIAKLVLAALKLRLTEQNIA
jgi:hypothetical protein